MFGIKLINNKNTLHIKYTKIEKIYNYKRDNKYICKYLLFISFSDKKHKVFNIYTLE